MNKLTTILSMPQFTTLEFILVSIFIFFAYILGWDEAVCMINGQWHSTLFGFGLCLMCADLGLFFKPIRNTIFTQFTAMMIMLAACIIGGPGSLFGGLGILCIVAIVWSLFSFHEEQAKKNLMSAFAISTILCFVMVFMNDFNISDKRTSEERYKNNPNCVWTIHFTILKRGSYASVEHKSMQMTGTRAQVQRYVDDLIYEQHNTPVRILEEEGRYFTYGVPEIYLSKVPLEDIKRNGDYHEWQKHKRSY